MKSPATKTLLINSEQLFDGFKVMHDASVLVKGGKIVEVGRRDFRADKTLETSFLMPGLIDMHVHVAGYTEDFRDPFKAVKNFLNLLLYNGVTAVRDVGNYLETKFFVEKWREKNPAPLFFSSGPMLDEPPLKWFHSRAVSSIDEAKTQVRRLHFEGMDLIKVYDGVKPKTLKAIVDEAHSKGLRVAGHLGATSAIEAAKIGIDTIEHAGKLLDKSYVGDAEKGDGSGKEIAEMFKIWCKADLSSERVKELIQILVERGTYVCPTLLVLRRSVYVEEGLKDPNIDYMEKVMPYQKYFKYMRNPLSRLLFSKRFKKFMPFMLTKEDRELARKGFEKISEFVGMLAKAGVKIIAGTDSPNPFIVPGFSLHQELELLVQAGLKPLQALKSATSTAAEALGKNLGVIEQGALANLLLIDGNPIKHVRDLEKIEDIILEGKVLERDELANRIE